MLHSIQACRTIAALLVVFFHAAGNLAKENYFGEAAAYLEKIFWFGGEAGVAFFFVLSGFIIHHVHRKDFDHPERLLPYLRKRATRIYPTYLIVFTGVCAISLLTPSLREYIPGDAFLLLKSLLLIPLDSSVVGGTGAPVLVVAWSLQYEILFYAVFATALLNRWVLLLAALAFTGNLVLEPLLGPYEFPRSFVSSHLVLLFVMGMASSVAANSKFKLIATRRLVISAAVAFLAVGALANLTRGVDARAPFNIAYGLVSASLLFALARHERSAAGPTEASRLARWGDSSYALYLIHFPLVAALSKISILFLPINLFGACVGFGVIVAASVAVAEAFHRLIERPLLRALSPEAARRLASDRTN
jgi:exopolysaccharide production protein ExoZ